MPTTSPLCAADVSSSRSSRTPDGTDIELTREDLLIDSSKKDGYVTQEDIHTTVVLDTNLTDELIREGFMREIISKVHTIYPRLSIMWLMFGEGPMLNTIEDAHAINPSENSLFENKADDASNYSIVTDCANQEFSGKNIPARSVVKTISKIVVFYSDNSFEEFHRL